MLSTVDVIFLIVWFLFSLSMNHFRIQFLITVSQDLVVH